VVRRAAFTFIELIFAIVIIAITVVSLPMMNQVIAHNTEHSLIQEAIFAAATELNEATTMHWDENSIENNDTNGLAKVINIDASCNSDTNSTRYRLRPGHIRQKLHRKCLNNLTLTEADSNTNTLVDAVEDSNHSSQEIFINPNPSAQGYKDDYNSTLVVDYNQSFDGNTRPNMKKITANIYDSDGNLIVSLTTYVANIGEIDYYKKAF
jgi:Tfp pilus assembly major pilin PilA